MSAVTIFKDGSAVPTTKRELSPLAKSLAVQQGLRRIQTNTNGTFKRIVNGEQVGKAVRGEFKAIIVDALPKPSKTYYAGKYDPDAKPTLPDCWSNLGDVPESGAPNKQAANCADCKQAVKGSAEGGRAACRFQRRVALLLEGDASGDVYQFNIPAKSLFGKGSGNTHPFESYVRFLAANGFSVDHVVTLIAYNLEADTMELNFTPVREVTDEEFARIQEVQADPELKRYTTLTVAHADNASAPKAAAEDEAPAKEKVFAKEEPAKEVTAADVWGSDDEDEETPAKEPAKRARAKKDDPAPAETKKLTEVLDAWADEE